MTDLNPGSRPRRGVLAVGSAALAAALTAGLLVALPGGTAGADELERFGSCEEVAAWGRASADARILDRDGAGGEVLTSGSPVPTSVAADRAESAESAGGAASAEGGTNVVVAGVDELDVVERLDGDRALVTAGATLAVVDLAAGEVLAEVPVPIGAQVTFDPEASVAWVVAGDPSGTNVVVRRVSVGDGTLEVGAEWSTSGWLVDARRIGDRLHLVATEGFTGQGDDVPFAGGPVACDQVLHPVGPSDPTATLLVTLPVDGDLAPVDAAQVVGAGQFVHVTTDAAYLATPLREGGEVTAIHRFDLDGLAPTGSGRVEGSLLDEFSMSEHDGHLRVAVTDRGFGGPMPMPMPMPMPIDDVGGTVAPSGDVVEVAPTEPVGEALNEVVVLDTEGELDEVGRTPRFGHPGETIHGIRFVGDVAYAVTFLQTDPFYVLDLADPTAPAVAGEVELPGFSAYLHPVSDSLVAGFGPGDDGRATVKLFDVSDPAAPKVADALTLGDESTVVYDHHAFVDLGEGRFAVPATSWGTGAPTSSVVVVDTAGGTLTEVERRSATTEADVVSRVLPSEAGWALLAGTELVLLDQQGTERDRLRIG